MAGITKKKHAATGVDPPFEGVTVDQFAFVGLLHHAEELDHTVLGLSL